MMALRIGDTAAQMIAAMTKTPTIAPPTIIGRCSLRFRSGSRAWSAPPKVGVT